MTEALLDATAGDSKEAAAPAGLEESLERFDQLRRTGFFTGPRYRIHYSILGEGPTVYIVPGMCSTQRTFALLALEMMSDFRVVLYDLPGVSKGDGANLRTYAFEDFPADLVALAEHLGDRKIEAMGFSFGSTITVRALHAFPDRIVKAMLVGTFAARPLTWFERFSLHAFRWVPGRVGRVPGIDAMARYNHGPELRLRDEALVEFQVAESGSTPVSTTVMQALMVDRTNLREIAPTIQQPVFVLHGESDRMVPLACAADLANRLPNVRVMVVPRCGHLPQLSHPELVHHVAREFFLNDGDALPCASGSGEHACPGSATCSGSMIHCNGAPASCSGFSAACSAAASPCSAEPSHS